MDWLNQFGGAPGQARGACSAWAGAPWAGGDTPLRPNPREPGPKPSAGCSLARHPPSPEQGVGVALEFRGGGKAHETHQNAQSERTTRGRGKEYPSPVEIFGGIAKEADMVSARGD